ncbi:Tetratricopeptide repeat-containing protein [Prosthecobacter debontii]|uniref:Tetratricopeptide repeat-containing protein n=1 Tax=Prosthecobacter debontii TaxID=48467 RepID=A0A1T4XZT7_9BACT|nr:tetratricopeptide repeat protein [Prosthecobacter debontii]SKA95072.1 Tetratricopeptide repeat-containing protein [Prosthecobacter debontii]
MNSRPPVFTLLAWFVCVLGQSLSPVHGCIWDSDTLASERARFPGIDLLITGSFATHSREFHEWRIAQRQKDIASATAMPEHYDDLAVSQHKLGQHKAAIATMQEKDKLVPGLYETYSNLGTFYIYTGELQKALTTIDQALAINPNAHFGREKYQKWLVQWILEKQQEPNSPQELITGSTTIEPVGFARFVARQISGGLPAYSRQKLSLSPDQRTAAIHGIRGMMWFADFNNPHLQEALGDLLIVGDSQTNANRLASLCYLHASLKATDPRDQKRLTIKCNVSGLQSRGFDIEKSKADLQKALNHGARYRESVRQDEVKWIAEGLDAQAEFQKK